MAELVAVTCDGNLPDGKCRRPAATVLNVSLRGRTLVQDLCEECALNLEQILIKGGTYGGGAHVTSASVDYKARNAYVAASGTSFTAEDARAWLVERDLASPRGRLSRDQLKAYADAH